MDWLSRAKTEQVELAERLAKLQTFMKQPAFLMLPTEDRQDLKAQRAGMVFYLDALTRRIDRHSPKAEIGQ